MVDKIHEKKSKHERQNQNNVNQRKKSKHILYTTHWRKQNLYKNNNNNNNNKKQARTKKNPEIENQIEKNESNWHFDLG